MPQPNGKCRQCHKRIANKNNEYFCNRACKDNFRTGRPFENWSSRKSNHRPKQMRVTLIFAPDEAKTIQAVRRDLDTFKPVSIFIKEGFMEWLSL